MDMIKIEVIHEIDNKSEAAFNVYKNGELIIKDKAFLGKNGITNNKKEGDGKTPIGCYKFGIAFGTHDIKEIFKDNQIDNLVESKESLKEKDCKIKYIKIDKNSYWVDDLNSKFYNQYIDLEESNAEEEKDWNSAEHLIDYPIQYEYAVEIKTNSNNIKGNGSAIFLHCSNNTPTAGCIAVKKEIMIEIFKLINKDSEICIK